jgi:hypothetical protein
MRYIIIIMAVVALLIVGCATTNKPTANQGGVKLTLIDDNGNPVISQNYQSQASALQAITAPEGNHKYRLPDSMRNAVKNYTQPKFIMEYTVTNTGNTPIMVTVDANIQGYFLKGNTTQ